jgi:guanylate kinase
MRESHQLQFPTDIQIIYVAPPALDEINRWLRDRETKEDI